MIPTSEIFLSLLSSHLSRWLIERFLSDNPEDPLIPFAHQPCVGPSMYFEITEDIPIKMPYAKWPDAVSKNIDLYERSCLQLVQSNRYPFPPDTYKNLEREFYQFRVQNEKEIDQARNDFVSLKKYYHMLREKCDPILLEYVKPTVDEVCLSVSSQASSCVNEIMNFKSDMPKIVRKQVHQDRVFLRQSTTTNEVAIDSEYYEKLKSLYVTGINKKEVS